MNVLSDVVKEKFSDIDNVEIKIFPGLKVTSKHIPSEQFDSHLKDVNISSDYILKLSAYFTRDFKNKIKEYNNQKGESVHDFKRSISLSELSYKPY